jgi:hypothetical protein
MDSARFRQRLADTVTASEMESPERNAPHISSESVLLAKREHRGESVLRLEMPVQRLPGKSCPGGDIRHAGAGPAEPHGALEGRLEEQAPDLAVGARAPRGVEGCLASGVCHQRNILHPSRYTMTAAVTVSSEIFFHYQYLNFMQDHRARQRLRRAQRPRSGPSA